MTARFAITYEEHVERATATYGADWARQHCPMFGRDLARRCREMAASVDGAEDIEVLHRLADRMDPDLREEAA